MTCGARAAACCLGALVACTTPAPPAPPAIAPAGPTAAVTQFVLEGTPSGEIVAWRVAATGAHGTLTPLRTFRRPTGYCRDYAVTASDVEGGGAAWQATACRDGGGQWRPVSDPG